jgi:hypothetical protein
VVLYDDMKLAFNGLLSQILAVKVSEAAYSELTLRVSEFSYRLEQCIGLDPGRADTRSVTSQEQDGVWSSQLAHNKSTYTGSKNRFKKLLSRKNYSWSCAFLPGFQAVFNPSIAPSYQTKHGPSHNTCGYCGEEFPNLPSGIGSIGSST